MRAWYSGWALRPVPVAVPPMPSRRKPLGRRADALRVPLHGAGIGAELLPQAHRHGVLQMGPPRLDHVVEFGGLVAELGGQALHVAS